MMRYWRDEVNSSLQYIFIWRESHFNCLFLFDSLFTDWVGKVKFKNVRIEQWIQKNFSPSGVSLVFSIKFILGWGSSWDDSEAWGECEKKNEEYIYMYPSGWKNGKKAFLTYCEGVTSVQFSRDFSRPVNHSSSSIFLINYSRKDSLVKLHTTTPLLRIFSKMLCSRSAYFLTLFLFYHHSYLTFGFSYS